MTISAGASGLILVGSPPRSAIASRMVARSTTQGTPVKSCMITRAGVNWISLSGSASASQPASAMMSSAVMSAPSSVRSRFSSSTLRLNGRLDDVESLTGDRVEAVDLVGPCRPTSSVLFAPKLSLLATSPSPRVGTRSSLAPSCRN